MSTIDWVVLAAFILFIVIYGSISTRKTNSIRSYILSNKSTRWQTVALSIMATQASAITFISTPGQAYTDGMGFVQFYLGLPLAMIILSITAVPIFHRLNVYTAYEYLETRFDLKNRLLGSILFLTQRGLAAGFTIFAPSLVLSVILGWNISFTVIITGILVIIYTTIGGTNAVNKTHILQMAIIFVGMIAAFFMIINLLPENIGFNDALKLAGKMNKLNALDFSFDLDNKYTFWSGIIGGTFLMLSYFGTDQSQVQRYLAGSSVNESRLGLLMNGILKIPMQFFILLIGVMVFVFFQFIQPPLYFNPIEERNLLKSEHSQEYLLLQNKYKEVFEKKLESSKELLAGGHDKNISFSKKEELNLISKEENNLRNEAKKLIKKANPTSDMNDTNYIFLTFVITYLPAGLIGLVLAAILSASMSSTSAELNSLASTTVIDIYKRLIKKDASDKHYLRVSKAATVLWGVYAIGFALFANRLGTLIEAVNVLGSLVYGTILGIFLVAFYFKRVRGTPTFISALIAEVVVLYCFIFTSIPFLWFNVISCFLIIILANLFSIVKKNPSVKSV
ncbi:MAG TPA: sodium:solute symporter [Ignavibacteriaceae bacterium]|nr:sodium:solute symporter [Ignavibacteriaceae bacterium]